MPPTTRTSPFNRCRERVKEMTDAGEPLSGIEEMLAEALLPADEKDALWLLAWARGRRPGSHGRISAPGEAGQRR